MVEQTAVDYANYLHQIDFAKEVFKQFNSFTYFRFFFKKIYELINGFYFCRLHPFVQVWMKF